MKKLATLTALALSFAATGAFAETLTGYVADAMCAKDPHSVSSADHAACAKKCIGMGSPAVLIVGTKIYTVSNPEKLNAFAGKTVTVDGSVAGDTLTVASVK